MWWINLTCSLLPCLQITLWKDMNPGMGPDFHIVLIKRRSDLQWTAMSFSNLQWATKTTYIHWQCFKMTHFELQLPIVNYDELQRTPTMTYITNYKWPTITIPVHNERQIQIMSPIKRGDSENSFDKQWSDYWKQKTYQYLHKPPHCTTSSKTWHVCNFI